MFILLALLLDLYKWCIFIAATADTDSYDYDLIYSLRKKRLAWAFSTASVLYIIAFGVMISVMMLILETDYYSLVNKNFISMNFFIFLACYIASLSLLIHRLKTRFEDYYQ